MATHDYVIDNATGANVRADINLVLQAILTNNSSSSAPSTTAAYMWWADTTNGVLKIRNSSDNAWVELLQLDGTLTLEDGSKTAPALAFRDDLNTGIFSSAADTFNVATAGVERLELGATTIFNEDGADVDFRIEGNSNANLFYLDAGNERIGIGSSSPNTTLHIFAPPLNTATLTTTNCLQLGLWVKPDGSGSNTTGHIYTGIALGDGFAGMYGIDAGASAATALGFFTGNNSATSERMRLDSSGRLSIGTTDVPATGVQLDLRKSSDTTVYSATANQPNGLSIFNPSGVDGGFSGIQIGSTSSSGHFGSTILKNVSVTTGYSSDFVVQTRHQGNYGERLRVWSEGGQTFNGDTAAANALDDYEEVSWTPIVSQGIDGGATHVIQRGWAVKIGIFVHFSYFLRFSGTGNGNHFRIGGLPFTTANAPYSAAYSSGASVFYTNIHFNNSNPQQIFIPNNNTYMEFYNNNSSNTSISGAGSNKDIYAGGHYRTDA